MNNKKIQESIPASTHSQVFTISIHFPASMVSGRAFLSIFHDEPGVSGGCQEVPFCSLSWKRKLWLYYVEMGGLQDRRERYLQQTCDFIFCECQQADKLL